MVKILWLIIKTYPHCSALNHSKNNYIDDIKCSKNRKNYIHLELFEILLEYTPVSLHKFPFVPSSSVSLTWSLSYTIKVLHARIIQITATQMNEGALFRNS